MQFSELVALVHQAKRLADDFARAAIAACFNLMMGISFSSSRVRLTFMRLSTAK